MATSQLSGLNYGVEGNAVTFFDNKGIRLSNGRWGINAFGGDMYVEVSPDTMLPTIRECIAGDVEDGNGDKISILLVQPNIAVILFLEGILTRDLIEGAIEGPDFIDIGNVPIDGRNLMVRVMKEGEYRIATANSEGVVL